MNQIRHSPNIVILRFPPLAGGKLLVTMLSYFDSFFYPFPMSHISPFIENLSDKELKAYGHTYAMASVPPKEMRHRWSFYEPTLMFFLGYNGKTIISSGTIDAFFGMLKLDEMENLTPSRSKTILNNYLCASVIVHSGTYEEISIAFPNAKIINLTDYTLIQNVSMRFKSHHNNSDRYLDEISGPNVINFSMENVFFKSKFIDNVSDLAFTLSGNNKYDPRMEEYYDKYKAVHL